MELAISRISVAQVLTIVYIAYVILLTIKIILDNKHPSVAIGWLLAIVFIPYAGVVLYLLSGVDWKKKKIVKFRPEEIFKEETLGIIDQQKAFLSSSPSEMDSDTYKSIILNLNSAGAVITLNNNCEFFFQGRELMDRMIEDLSRAEKFIHMEFFIWRSDVLGEIMADLLIAKAAAGVDVRLLFDGVGCFMAMSYAYKRRLRKGGVHFRYFLNPLNPLFGRLLNYRNHRKIVVIDGQIAYTGGMNMGQEYVDGGARFKAWRDTAVRINGESTQFLEGIFLSDWANSGGADSSPHAYLSSFTGEATYLPMQIVCSGPDSEWNALELFIFNMICNADQEVLIQSPYFIPNESLLTAMQTAALTGVRVRIMMTGIADKAAPFWAARTYFEELLKAGVEFYLYEKGFLHAKMYIADDKIASMGTCNLDIRSLQLLFEVNSVFYDESTIKILRDQFEADVKNCRQITLENLKKRNLFFRLRDSLFRMVSPVL